MHDATKVLMGACASNIRDVTSHDANPANFPAGYAVRRSTTDSLQFVDDSTAALIGVSAGPDLSNALRTAVFRKGRGIPIRLKNAAAALTIGDLTYTAKLFGVAGNAITITQADTLTDGSATVEVDGLDITVNIESTATDADTIKAAIEASTAASALVSVTVANGQGETAQSAAAEDNLADGDDVAVTGEGVLVDDTTGEASVDGDPTGAVYASGVLTGVYPDGTEVPVALIDMVGGL